MATTAEEAKALAAEALKELATVPAEDVSYMFQAARNHWKAASAGTAAAQAVLAWTALDELAAMPEEERREVVGRVINLGGRIEGKTTLSGELTVEGAARLAGTAELVRATGDVRSPSWSLAGSIRRHPVLWWLLGALAQPHLERLSEEVLRQLMALIAAGHLNATEPAPSGEPPQPPAIVRPVAQPPVEACLPSSEPERR